MDWHRRKAKPGWCRYFYVRTLSPAELTGGPDALGGLADGEIVGWVSRPAVRRFSFPPQEHRFSASDLAIDPATGKGWTVWAVDDAAGTIDLKIGNGYAGPLPSALVEGGPIPTTQLRERLRELGGRVVRDGVRGGMPACSAQGLVMLCEAMVPSSSVSCCSNSRLTSGAPLSACDSS